MIHYPNGKKYQPATPISSPAKVSYANRGQSLEDEIHLANQHYLQTKQAVIHKKPVPVQIVNVHYPARSAAVITEAYFRTPSTTDFNGVWEGHYVDFEAKETKSTTSFPLQNIHHHQFVHMSEVYEQFGLTFLLIKFTQPIRYFIVPYTVLQDKWNRMENGGRKSIPLSELENEAIEFTHAYPIIDYLQTIRSHKANLLK